MKALRVVLAVLGGLLVLLVVAAVIFINTFDPNSLKDELTAYIYDRTGRTLVIEDSIELSLFPWFAVETGGVSLSDDPAFGDRNLITIDELSARVRVWPLLKRRIEIGRVVFDGISMNLGMDADGRGNWETLRESGSNAPADATNPSTSDTPQFRQLAVEGVELRNARIRWHDAGGEVIYIVRNLNLESGEINDSEPVNLHLTLSLLDVASQASIELDLETIYVQEPQPRLSNMAAAVRVLDALEDERVRADLAIGDVARSDQILRAAPVALTASLVRASIGPESQTAMLRLDSLELDTRAETLIVDALTTQIGGISASWTLRGDSVLSNPLISGNVSARGNSLAAIFATLDQALPAAVEALPATTVALRTDFTLQANSRELVLRNLNLDALGISASGNASRTADGSLNGRIDIPQFSLSGAALEALQAFMPEGTDLSAADSAAASASFNLTPDRRRLVISDLAVALDAASLAGNVDFTGPEGGRTASGKLLLTGLDNPLLESLAANALPASLLEAELGQFRLATDFSHVANSGVTELNPIQLTAYGLSGDGHVTVRGAGDNLSLSGQASLASFSPRALLARFNQPVPESSDPAVLRAATLAASFETTGNDGHFRDIAIDLDDSRITGEFSVTDFADPSYRFVLRADQIDVDRYLPPKAAAAVDDAAGTDERRVGDIELAEDTLTRFVVQGSANVGTLTIGGLRYEQLSANLTMGGGSASLSSVQTRLYGGEFAGGVSIDTTGALPSLHLTGTARDLGMRPMLSAMLGASHLSGTGDFDLDLTGTGATIGAAMQTAAGTMALTLRDGEIVGVNAGREVCAAMNSANGLPAPDSAPETTVFSRISGTATVADGIASTADILITNSSLRLNGRANMQLAEQFINAKLIAHLVGPVNLRGCERLNSRVDDSIPIGFTLEGKLPDVKVVLDIGQLIEDWARREIRQRGVEALRDGLDRLLN